MRYAGFILLLALIIGGGTVQQLWTDQFLLALMIPAMAIGLLDLGRSRLTVLARFLIAAIALVLFLQFLPFSPSRMANMPFGPLQGSLFSLSPGRSLEAALYAGGLLGYVLFVSRFSDDQLSGMVRFLVVGLGINLAVGTIQLAYVGGSAISGLLPYQMRLGTFANPNHQSTLLLMVIPLLAQRYLSQTKQPIRFLIAAVVLVFYLLANGSQAGLGIAVIMMLLSVLWFAPKRMTVLMKLTSMAFMVVIVGVATYVALTQGFLRNDDRLLFFENTWRAIADNLPFGAGLGSFPLIYPAYEAFEDISGSFVNHAHNDYLELVLEIGVLAPVLLLVFFVLIGSSAFRSSFNQAAFLAASAVLLHSLVDYPLRTLAIAVPFSFLAATLACMPAPERRKIRRSRHEQPVPTAAYQSETGRRIEGQILT
ncbi:MAG: O-antigen ligase family protein [Pseudomonadota bacterium]